MTTKGLTHAEFDALIARIRRALQRILPSVEAASSLLHWACTVLVLTGQEQVDVLEMALSGYDVSPYPVGVAILDGRSDDVSTRVAEICEALQDHDLCPVEHHIALLAFAVESLKQNGLPRDQLEPVLLATWDDATSRIARWTAEQTAN